MNSRVAVLVSYQVTSLSLHQVRTTISKIDVSPLWKGRAPNDESKLEREFWEEGELHVDTRLEEEFLVTVGKFVEEIVGMLHGQRRDVG